MRRTRPILILLALSLLTSHAGAQDARQEVLAVVKRMFDGMRAGDSAMVASTFHPSLRLISAFSRNGTPQVRIEASAAGFLKAVGTPHADAWDERIANEKVAIDGPVASVWADYSFYLGGKRSHCGIDHFLLVKDDAGAWKILELADTRRPDGCTI